jgi:hypothetical protein
MNPSGPVSVEFLVTAKGVALLIGLAFFLTVAIRLFLGKKERFGRAAEIPLVDDRVVEPRAPKARSRTGNAAKCRDERSPS